MILARLRNLEVVRNFISLGILDSTVAEISRLHIQGLKAGVESPKFHFIPWNIAKYTESENRLYIRLWGSSETLPQQVKTTLVGLKASLMEGFETFDEENYRSLVNILVQNTVEDELVKEQIEQKLFPRGISTTALLVSEATEELGIQKILEIVKSVSSKPDPNRYFREELKENSRFVERVYNELDKQRFRKIFDVIVRKQVRKPEFLRVMAKKGKVNLSELQSVYSFLMAAIYQFPGRNLGVYHNLRQRIRKERRSLSTTSSEINDLIYAGYIIRRDHGYYSKEYEETELSIDQFLESHNS